MPFDFLKQALRIPKEESEKDSLAEVEEGTHFSGHNVWLLVISMGIACIGLNINSPAAVIGAMLISPLMGPIVGVAFGFATGHRHLMHLGFKNWILMISVALTSSTIYFLVSPFHAETEQLAAFKNATVFDCFLAIFGGFAWFLGIIRKEAIKVIAGVAVSTACIPPLCTAGFGLATQNWDYFWGGFYFYLINCFFIGLGTWILTIVLGYQKYFLRQHRKQNKTVSVLVGALSVIVLIPSVFLTIQKWQNENLSQRSRNYVDMIKKNHPELVIINYEPFEKNNEKFLKIILLNDSTTISKSQLNEHNNLIKDIHLIWQYSPNSSSDKTDLKTLQGQIISLQNEINTLKTLQKTK